MAAAAAAIIAREKRIVEAFRIAGATSPATAVVPASIGVAERVAFHRLRRHAALREVGAGAFYLDEPSWEACRAWRQRVAGVVLVVLLLFLVAITLGWFRLH